MKKHFMRFALCFALLMTAVLSYAVKPSETEIKAVKAYGSYGPVKVLDTQYSSWSYEDYVSLFYENWTSYIHTLDQDWLDDGGEITNITLYEMWNGDWDEVWDTNDTPWDTSDDSPCALGVMSPLYEYAVKFKFSAGGEYLAGESTIIPFSILPCSISNNFDLSQFTGVYDDKDNWYFNQDFYWVRQHDPYTNVEDEVDVVWCYDIGDETFELDNDTDVGTYSIYPVLVGAQKDRYELNLTYSDPMMGIHDEPITKENPVACTITKRNIKVNVSYCDKNLKTYEDGASEIVNYIRYNGVLPLVAYCSEYNVKVNIDWFRDATNYDLYTEGISKLGTYFATSAAFSCVEEETYLNPKNFNIVDSNIKINISERYIIVTGEMFSKYCYAPSYPDYDVYVKVDPLLGETDENVIVPTLHFDPGSNIPSEYLAEGYAILALDDPDSYIIEIDGGMDYAKEISWTYTVSEGDATIEATQIRPWYYGEILDDIEDIFEFNVYTDDPEETVEIYSIEWTFEAFPNEYTTWHNIVVNGSDPESGYPQKWALDSLYLLEYGLNIRVTTDYSSGGKYTMTSKVFHVEYAKAPVYIRVVDEVLVFNNENQAPSWDSYRFYIFEPGKAENLWDTASVYVDITDFVEYYYDSTLDEYVPHVWGTNNSDAGKYSLLVVLTEQALQRYELIENGWGAFTHDGEMVDPDSYYIIYKKGLNVGSMTIDTMTYGQEPINYYLLDYKPTISGFVEGDYNTEKTSEKWYFNTTSLYASDEEWLPLEDMPGYPYVNVGTYYIKYVATYDNYQDVVATAQLKVIAKELTILWYTDEDAVEVTEGIDTENSISLNVANYVYNGTVQKPHYEISGYYYFDVPTVTESKISKNDWDYGDGIKVGQYFYQLSALSSANYTWPHRYPSCMALYTVYARTIYITPDQGLSTIYFDDDPELTYTYSNYVPGEDITFTGSLSRENGMTVGTYEIYLGSLELADTETNANYTILLSAEDYYVFTVTPRDITANFSIVSKVYTSANINPDFSSFTGLIGTDDVTIQYTTESIDVNTYNKGFKIVGDDAFNYALTETTVVFTITQATLDFTAVLDSTNATLSVEYDGNPHTLTVTPTGIKVNDEGRVAIVIEDNSTGTTAQTYTAALSLTGDKADNYKLAKTSVTWYITPKGVDMTQFNGAFADNTVTYDGTSKNIKVNGSIPEHYTYKLYVGEAEFAGATEVGAYTVKVVFTSDDTTNYPNVNPITRTLTIEQREVTITWTKTTFTYNGEIQFPEYTINNVVAADKTHVTINFNNNGAKDKSTTNIIATEVMYDGEKAQNYYIAANTQIQMIISAMEITVVADDQETVYGENVISAEDCTAKVTEGYIVPGDTNVYKLSHNVSKTSAVRDYTITVTKDKNSNYNVTCVNGTYNVVARNITITADAKSSVYGDSLETLTAKVTNGSLVNGDSIDKLVTITSVVTSTSLVADNYLIKVEDKGNTNYNVTTQNAFYALTPRSITVTAVNKTSVYGEDTVALTATYGITEPVPGDMPYALDCEVVKGTEVGTYAITVRKINNNYTVVGVDAVYTVTARPMTIAIADKTSIYGNATEKLTHEIVKGKYYGDDIARDVFKLNCVVNTTTNVGLYNITGEVINDNYNITFINGTESEPNYDLDHGVYTVTERALLITVVNKTSVYGDNQVALEGVDTNGQIVNNDTDVFALTCEVTKLSHVGLYNIIGSRLNTNYNITFANEENSYEVTKKDLRVIANNDTVTYGDEIPAYTVEYDGFVNQEDKLALGGELVFTCAYTNTSLVNTYAIVPSGYTSDDYNILYSEGTLTVERKAITVTFESTHKEATYGDEEGYVALGEEMTTNHFYLVADWVGEDTVENSLYYYMVNEDNEDITKLVGPTLPVGTYNLVVEGRNVNNYDFTIKLGDEAYLTVNKKALTITADNKNIIYGNVAPVYTVSYAGFVNNEDETVLGGELVFAGQYNQYNAIGDYTITPSGLTSDNYEITFVNGTCAVAQRVINVTIADKTSVYGDATVSLTATEPEGSIVNNDVPYSLHCDVTSATIVGNYEITGTTEDTNYIVNFVKGTYTITQREVTLTWTNDSFVYNEEAHKPTATAGNLVNNDVVVVTVTGEKVVAGTHTATASMLSNANYKLPAAKTHEFTITKAPGYDKPLDVATVSNGIDLTEIFNNVDTTAADTKIDLAIGDAVVTFDKAAIDKIAGKENVVFKFETITDDAAKEVYKKAVAVFEISLSGVTFDGGTVTVTTKFENKAPFGKVAKLYYIDGNKKTDMKATFTDDEVSFDTPHFSTFAVVYTLSTLSIIIIILVVLIAIGAIVYFVVIPQLTKGGNAPATTTEEVAETEPTTEETVEEPTEEPVEETTEETTDNE